MTTPFYGSPETVAALVAEAQRWIGTPFRYGSCVRGAGGGVDCTHLCYAVHLACGAFAPFEVPSAPLNWHQHHDESIMLDFLRAPEAAGRLKHIDRDDPTMTGDLAVVRVSRTEHHMGTVLRLESGAFLLHVPLNHPVQLSPLADPAMRITSLWRLSSHVPQT